MSTIYFFNNTIVYNNGNYNGGGFFASNGGNITGYNNIIWGNMSASAPEVFGPLNLSYTACSEFISGEGNITDDPMFVDPEADNYNLQSGSPCIDTGDPNSPLDLDNTRADMGALYFSQLSALEDNPSGFTPSECVLYSPYPNPFNASTVISFELQDAGFVSLKIFDITGRTAGLQNFVPINQYLPAGQHSVVFDAEGLTSGVYFVQLEAGENRQTRKILLIK